jgi:hypothetical protein
MQDGVIFNHQTVSLDGEVFSNCEFAACRMVYAGGPPPQFDGCRFADCEWKFEDGADLERRRQGRGAGDDQGDHGRQPLIVPPAAPKLVSPWA